MSITGKRPYTDETSSKALAAVMPRTAAGTFPDDIVEKPTIHDTGTYTKTRITVQFANGPDAIPTDWRALQTMLDEMDEGEAKVTIVQAETRVRRVEFGRKYL